MGEPACESGCVEIKDEGIHRWVYEAFIDRLAQATGSRARQLPATLERGTTVGKHTSVVEYDRGRDLDHALELDIELAALARCATANV